MISTHIKLLITTLLVFSVLLCKGQNIGIGIPNPNQKLEIDEQFFCDSMFITEKLSSIFGSVIARLEPSNNKIFLANDNICITPQGKMGIGTDNPTFQVHVVGETNANTILVTESLKGPELNGNRSNFIDIDPVSDSVYVFDGIAKYHDNQNLTITKNLVFKDQVRINNSIRVGSNGTDITTMKTKVVVKDFGTLNSQSEKTYYYVMSNTPSDASASATLLDGDLPGAVVVGQVFMEDSNSIGVKLINMGSNNQVIGPRTILYTIID